MSQDTPQGKSTQPNPISKEDAMSLMRAIGARGIDIEKIARTIQIILEKSDPAQQTLSDLITLLHSFAAGTATMIENLRYYQAMPNSHPSLLKVVIQDDIARNPVMPNLFPESDNTTKPDDD